MKISVKPGCCASSGQCAFTAPQLFDQNPDNGEVVVLQSNPPPELHALARLAENLCPTATIVVEEETVPS